MATNVAGTVQTPSGPAMGAALMFCGYRYEASFDAAVTFKLAGKAILERAPYLTVDDGRFVNDAVNLTGQLVPGTLPFAYTEHALSLNCVLSNQPDCIHYYPSLAITASGPTPDMLSLSVGARIDVVQTLPLTQLRLP
jgi:hypothetical protein